MLFIKLEEAIMDPGTSNLPARCKCCNKPFLSLARGKRAHVCDLCFRTVNGRTTELNEYCKCNPQAELLQISKALNVNLSEVLSLINYNDAMNGNNNLNVDKSRSGLDTVGEIYNYEKEERRLARNSSSKLVSDLERFRRH